MGDRLEFPGAVGMGSNIDAAKRRVHIVELHQVVAFVRYGQVVKVLELSVAKETQEHT